MELWELNACVKAYNAKQRAQGRESIIASWQTAALVSQAFSKHGLKKISHYLKEPSKSKAPSISKEEFEEKLRHAKRGEADGS